MALDSITTPQYAILATLRFFAIWQHPLNLAELKKFLLKFDLSEKELKTLCNEIPEVLERDGFYTVLSPRSPAGGSNSPTDKEGELEGGKIPDPFTLRQQRKPLLEKRLKKAHRYLPFLRFIPFIRAVYVCNNLSFGIATETGDIDLLIVTEKNHIFLARFLTTIFLHLLGVRRHGQKTTDRFCLSFYVTEDNLDFSPIALRSPTKPAAGDQQLSTFNFELSTIDDIYLAYWTYSLLPIFEIHENHPFHKGVGDRTPGVFDETRVESQNDPSSIPYTPYPILSLNAHWLKNYINMVKYQSVIGDRLTVIARSEARTTRQSHSIYIKQPLFQKLQEYLWNTKPGIWLNSKLANFQKNKISQSLSTLFDSSGIIVTDKMLKFHGEDRRDSYNKNVLRVIHLL